MEPGSDLNQNHTQACGIEACFSLNRSPCPGLLSLLQVLVEICLIVPLSERSPNIVEREPFVEILIPRRIHVEVRHFGAFRSLWHVLCEGLGLEDGDVHGCHGCAELRGHASPAVLAPHQEAAVAEKPHPELERQFVQAGHELPDPPYDIDWNLTHVDDPDEDVGYGFAPNKRQVEYPVQSKVNQVPHPDQHGGREQEPDLRIELPEGSENLESPDQRRRKEVRLIAVTVACLIPVPVGPHVNCDVGVLLLPQVERVLLDVAREGIVPVVEGFFLLCLGWSDEFLSGCLHWNGRVVWEAHRSFQSPDIVTEIVRLYLVSLELDLSRVAGIQSLKVWIGY